MAVVLVGIVVLTFFHGSGLGLGVRLTWTRNKYMSCDMDSFQSRPYPILLVTRNTRKFIEIRERESSLLRTRPTCTLIIF